MKTSKTYSRWSGLKRRLVMLAVLVGMTGCQLGCGLKCETVAGFGPAVAPVVFLPREIPEARKTELEIERLEAERRAQRNPQ